MYPVTHDMHEKIIIIADIFELFLIGFGGWLIDGGINEEAEEMDDSRACAC